MPELTIENGVVLLADPFMMDPNFKRSVILLCEHQDEGSVGFILNKPLKVKVDGLIDDFPEFDAEINFGGPVATDTIHYIHNVGDLLEESIKVENGIYWGGNFEKLKFLIKTELISTQNIKFFVGYSGWTSGQLKNEMVTGSWITSQMDSNYLFKISPDALWKKVLKDKGENFSILSEIPEPFSWN